MYSDYKVVQQLVSLMKQADIKNVVVSPGSRDVALIHSFENDPFFKLYSVVDERSAAFFALGIILRTGAPCAVCCSSGTACMNYGSAIVEAYYQHLPLLVISADRLPQFLNQLEDQMYDQLDTFTNCTKYHAQLTDINNPIDEWYCNRLINEAIIELTHRVKGPVHLNIPFIGHGTFKTTKLPQARKISLTTGYAEKEKWVALSERLKNKKILIVWGQSVEQSEQLDRAVERFCEKTSAVIATDNISNCQCRKAIRNTLTILLGIKDRPKDFISEYMPDILISIGGNTIFNQNIKPILHEFSFEHWLVSEEGKVCDPFHKLTEIFEMPEYYFFNKIAELCNAVSDNGYCEKWQALSSLQQIPDNEYGEMYAIGCLIRQLPEEAELQIANSLSCRMAHLFKMNPRMKVFCNRGVNGIDGSMSTAIGYSANNNHPTYLIIGDLSFFYDLNSLWIRHIGKRMRILLINNQGGALLTNVCDEAKPTVGNYIAAFHNANAKGWVESLGFKYVSATNKKECDNAINILLNTSEETPVVVEVFTNIDSDSSSIANFANTLDKRSTSDKLSDDISQKATKAAGKLKKIFKL